MISVMTSKWVGDALGKDGIYAVWIAMRRYPWLPPVDYRDRGETGATLMKPLGSLFVIEDGKTTVKEMIQLLKKHDFHGFPVVDRHSEFVGYATREELQLAICSSFIPVPSRLLSPHFLANALLSEEALTSRRICTFSQNHLRIHADERLDLSGTLEQAVIQLRKEVPQELVVKMFQKLVRFFHLISYA